MATEGNMQVLDQVKEAELEESVRHLTTADLDAYLQGRLPAARLNDCRTHLDSCEACRAELEDLRTFKSDSAAFARAEPARRGLHRGKGRRGLPLPLAAAIATIVVAVIAAVLWWGWERPRANTTSAAMTGAPSLAPAPTAGVAARDTQPTPTDDSAAPPAHVRPAASAGAHAIPGAPQSNTVFALLGPFGEAIAETRPEFNWQPLAGAIRYSVVIVDSGLHPVQRSPALRTTHWRPRRPLRRGRTYLWQVTATLRGGAKVVASAGPSAGAVLQIAP